MLERLAEIARARSGDGPAHDWLHVQRVANGVRQIVAAEGGNVEVAVGAALLHELFNHPKGHPESHLSGDRCAEEAERVLYAEKCDEKLIEQIAYCIRVHSFSRGILPETLEAKILQDADRLDAIGAIGIARCFATCAEMKRPFYATEDPFCERRAPDDKNFGIDHFYKKLLKIPDGLHTQTARRIAERRATFMRQFLEELAQDVGGEITR
jgi:uncharacterized protein